MVHKVDGVRDMRGLSLVIRIAEEAQVFLGKLREGKARLLVCVKDLRSLERGAWVGVLVDGKEQAVRILLISFSRYGDRRPSFPAGCRSPGRGGKRPPCEASRALRQQNRRARPASARFRG